VSSNNIWRSLSVVILKICSHQLSFCLPILSVKFNIFHSELMSVLHLDLECIQLLDAGTSFLSDLI
jgi:hypothetical protein